MNDRAHAIFAVRLSTIGRLVFPGSTLLLGIGKRSYSMYLVHFFVIDLVRVAGRGLRLPEISPVLMVGFIFFVSVTLTYMISGVTERAIERPGIDLGRRVNRWFTSRLQ